MRSMTRVEAERLACESNEEEGQRIPEAATGRRKFALLAFAAVSAAAVVIGWIALGGPLSPGSVVGSVALSLDPENYDKAEICRHYPKLVFSNCTHSNLALKGPDKEAEGIVYRARSEWTGHEFEVVLNSISGYKPFSTRLNGLSGEYGAVNLVPGTSFTVRFSVRDTMTKEATTRAYFSLSFFNLDQGVRGSSRMSLTVSDVVADRLLPNSGKDVEDIRNADGSRSFRARTSSIGAENPKDPLALSESEVARALTLRFENFQSVDVTFSTTAGIEPRFFTFVAYPAPICAGHYRNPVLDDLVYEGTEDTPVEANKEHVFKEWYVKRGQHVKKAEALFATLDGLGGKHVTYAPVEGVVTALHASLREGHLLRVRLQSPVMLVITGDMLSPLVLKAGDTATLAPAGRLWRRYHVQWGETITKGDIVATVEDGKGEKISIPAPKSGPVLALQGNLHFGDSVDRVPDLNIATIGRLPALRVPKGRLSVEAPQNAMFVRYLFNVGDPVGVNMTLAVVDVGGKMRNVPAPATGTIVERQQKLRTGMLVDEVLSDEVIMVLDPSEEKANQLEAREDEAHFL